MDTRYDLDIVDEITMTLFSLAIHTETDEGQK